MREIRIFLAIHEQSAICRLSVIGRIFKIYPFLKIQHELAHLLTNSHTSHYYFIIIIAVIELAGIRNFLFAKWENQFKYFKLMILNHFSHYVLVGYALQRLI